MGEDPTKKLRIATIFSYGANEGEADGILDEENSEDTSALDQPSREFLEEAIQIITKCSIRTMTPPVRNSRIIIKTCHWRYEEQGTGFIDCCEHVPHGI